MITQLFQNIITFLTSLYNLLFPQTPTFYHETAPCTALLQETTLTKRALPNRRLITAFGIENAFTTISPQIHQNFLNKVSALLEKSNNDISRRFLAADALRIGQEYIERSPSPIVSLSKLVQVVVFRTVLTIFFPHVAKGFTEDGLLKDIDVKIISAQINKLWYDSKDPWKVFAAQYGPRRWSSIMREREILLERLELQFPWYRTYLPQRNPLNILVPAHQGLWGVVLRCLIEVRFRSQGERRREWMELFRWFLGEPTEAWHRGNEKGLEVQMIVAETLRLYPPTKRMYIQQEDGRLDAVDIEKMHRVGERWGDDPLVFRPERWVEIGLDVVGTDCYMPFGRKVGVEGDGKADTVSQCPSRLRGGPKLIAVIVGALLELLDEEWELEDGWDMKDDIFDGEPLRSGKDAYESLGLWRRHIQPFEILD
ncbi:uncharacterized protein LY89DRAFT_689401 [Mollisia scopiformis]|uniref:Uncharacterized protein n=1 Tax=Mollisia scopiformis TaxID=149040 RepID=A0A194WS29_MOLSC|nr:uncharacterized protein LY89DRAFT_689401 [Mollisia scopiformis]KUJ10778.1 hypothetical protein LY89DRAFT_689401 [Mollisia scopiformis]